MALTRRAYICPQCGYLIEERQLLSSPSGATCPCCSGEATRYFGGQEAPPINLGWRGTHGYSTEADARIAQYQFEHL